MSWAGRPAAGDRSEGSPAAGGFVGIAFRQCHPEHTGVTDTVRASAAFPSRFTPPGGRFGVLYVALAPETATAELRRRAAQLGMPVSALAPRAKEWCDDPPRCREAGIPDPVAFHTKPLLAREMLKRALDAGVPTA